MIIKFSYYEDEDFGLTAFPEIESNENEIFENKKINKIKNKDLKKKKKEYTKYLITGIMEDFPDIEIIDIFLDLNSEGKTIIMATHDANIVNKMKKRVVTFNDRKVMSDVEN